MALLLGGFGWAGAQHSGQQSVRIGLGYLPNVQFTPFYVSDKLGYYKSEGVNVKFQHGFINELMPLLLQGKLDFIVGDPEDAVLARSQGAPLKYVMAIYGKSPVTLFGKNLGNLRGKTIGIPGPYGSSYYALQAYLDGHDLKEGQDIKVASIGYTQVDAVRTGKVDAAVGYVNNEVVNLRGAGVKVQTIDLFTSYPMVGVGIITTEKSLGTLAKRVVSATQRGLKFTLEQPERAFKVAQPVFGDGGGSLEVLRASLPLVKNTYTAQYGLGASNPAGWDKAIAALIKQGKLPAGTGAAQFYTNELINKTLK